MAKKITLTVNVDAAMAETFRKFVTAYNNKPGMCLSAALLLYLRATEKARLELHRELFDAQFGDGMVRLLKGISLPTSGSDVSSKKNR